MSNSNVVYMNDKKVENVIITSDSKGHNNIPNFTHDDKIIIHEKNTWWINGEIISNAVIITDNVGNNDFKSLFEVAHKTEPESKDIFKEVLLSVHEANQSKHVNMNSYLEKKRLNFIDKLRCATGAYHENSYLKSYAILKECLQIYNADDYRDEFLLTTNDYVAIKLALALSRLRLGKGEDLKEATHILIALKAKYGKQFPSICYYLGHTLYLLQHYDQSQNIIQEGLKNIEELTCLTELNWPGSDKKMIQLSDKAILVTDLEKLYNECKVYHKPDALCWFLPCPKKLIYFTNPCFNGYVNLKCTKNCNISYHRECWKLKLKINQIKKPSLIIDSVCGTSDCGGLMKEIVIYDEKLNINTTIPSNTKISHTDSKWYVNNKSKQVPSVKDVTEKPVPDSKSVKEVSADSFSTWKPAKQKNTLISNEKTTQTQNNVFVNTHTQTSIQTKEKQIQTVKIAKPPQKIPQTKEKRLQTDIDESSEIYGLKSQVDVLRMQLFEAEEAYNELLHEYNGYVEKKKKKRFFDSGTQTLNSACTDCKKGQTLIEEKTADIVALRVNVYELLHANKQLTLLNKDLQSSILRNQNNYEQSHKTLLKENENLKTLAQSFQSTLNRSNTNRKDIPFTFQSFIKEQFSNIGKAYLSYFSMYENKCKHMMWELQDLISLATYDSFPSKQELEENLAVWTNAIDDCKNKEQLVTNFFSLLINNFSQENLINNTIPNLLEEPPNIMMRHFKAILAINRKLEQDMNKNLMAFYKSSNPSYPQQPLNEDNMIDFNSDFLAKFGAYSVPQACSLPVDNLAKEPEATNTPPVNNSTTSTVTNKNSTSQDSKTPLKNDTVAKVTLVGQDKLLQRIEQQFPLAPPQTLIIALQTIRQRHGGLTGRDFRSIVLEVKTIVKEISGNTKEKVKISQSKQSNENPSLPPWKQVSSGVKWSNENPDLNCTICFDIMEKKNLVSLRCQHMFHRECIKKWLQTDSICPICRMFAILDDEFPPLK